MAAFALTDGFLSLGGTDVSSDVKSMELTADGETVDDSAMGDSWRSFLRSVKSWTLSVEFNDDVANSGLDDVMWAAFDAGTAIAMILRTDSSAVGTSNPEYTGNVIPDNHVIGGSWGDLASKSLTFTGTGALARAES